MLLNISVRSHAGAIEDDERERSPSDGNPLRPDSASIYRSHKGRNGQAVSVAKKRYLLRENSCIISYALHSAASWTDVLHFSIPSASDARDENSIKAEYIRARPRLLAQFNAAYDARIQQGSKGRLVIFAVADLDEGPFARTLLSEAPLDLANSCRWRHKYLPGVIRVATSADASLHLDFLLRLEQQYFAMRSLSHNSGGSQSNSRSNSLETLVQEQLAETGRDETEAEEKGKPKVVEDVFVGANPFDITLVTSSLENPIFSTIFPRILELHELEIRFCLAPGQICHEIGSGAQIFVIGGQLVTSTSIWRRLDWLFLAQIQFCPRFWNLSSSPRQAEFLSLLDYRSWVARFDDVEALLGEPLVDFPDSTWAEVKRKLDAGVSDSFNRRRREANWSTDFLLSQLGIRNDGKAPTDVFKFDHMRGESNEWRITADDFPTWQELLICLQRTRNYQVSLSVLADHLQGKPKLPAAFAKLEALALLKLDPGQDGKAREMLKQYRRKLLANFQDEMLLKGTKLGDAQQGQIFAEVAAVALVDGDAKEALDFARKALDADRSLAGAYKTLVWASIRTGQTSLEQEDLIFTFFVSYLRDPGQANEYYSMCVSKHPTVGIYKYAYAIFLQFVRYSVVLGKELSHSHKKGPVSRLPGTFQGLQRNIALPEHCSKTTHAS